MAARQALALLAILAVIGTAAAHEDEHNGKGKQCSKRGKEPCPTCLPAKAGCIKTKCSAEHPGYAKVTLKSKRCFTTERISYTAMSYGDEKKEHVCKDNKKSKGDDKFEILAKCGSSITIFLQEGKYYNKRGDYFPPASNPCSKKCDSKKSCDTCGPYTVPVICSCAPPPPKAVSAPPKMPSAPRLAMPPPQAAGARPPPLVAATLPPATPPVVKATPPPATPPAGKETPPPATTPPAAKATPPPATPPAAKATPPPATPSAGKATPPPMQPSAPRVAMPPAATKPPPPPARVCHPKKWNCRHGKCRNHQSPCPFCYKTLRECFSCIGCSRKPGYGTVVLKAKRCFKKSITFAAVSYKDEAGHAVCVDNTRYPYWDRESHKESKFVFSAPCGSTVTLYLVDDAYYNQNGPLYLKKKTNPCVDKCDKRKPCSTCGPYSFTVKCPVRCVKKQPPALPPPGMPMAPHFAMPPPQVGASPPPKPAATIPPAMPSAPKIAMPPPNGAATPPPKPAATIPPAMPSSTPPKPAATTPPAMPSTTPPKPAATIPPAMPSATPPKPAATTPPAMPSAPKMSMPPPQAATIPPLPPKVVSKPPPPPTCPVTPHSRSCPTCIPSTKGCIKYSCSKWDGYAKVTLKGSKCFDKPISFMAIAHNDKDAHPKCAHNKQKKSDNSFTFYAKCGQSVAVYLSDPKFSNQKGPLAIAGGNPCSVPCKEQGSACQTCGTYKIYIDCKCTKKPHHHDDKKKHG